MLLNDSSWHQEDVSVLCIKEYLGRPAVVYLAGRGSASRYRPSNVIGVNWIEMMRSNLNSTLLGLEIKRLGNVN